MSYTRIKFSGLVFLQFTTCILISSCGTLGSIGDRITFPTTKDNLLSAIEMLYVKNPQYKVPEKWDQYNDWSKRGYDFLESRIFYFKSPPEEMYYVTFVSPNTPEGNIAIGIRAVFNGDVTKKWWLDENDLSSDEKKRIINRFNDEIVLKIEEYTNTKISK